MSASRSFRPHFWSKAIDDECKRAEKASLGERQEQKECASVEVVCGEVLANECQRMTECKCVASGGDRRVGNSAVAAPLILPNAPPLAPTFT